MRYSKLYLFECHSNRRSKFSSLPVNIFFLIHYSVLKFYNCVYFNKISDFGNRTKTTNGIGIVKNITEPNRLSVGFPIIELGGTFTSFGNYDVYATGNLFFYFQFFYFVLSFKEKYQVDGKLIFIIIQD